jgi:hypothetical protein
MRVAACIAALVIVLAPVSLSLPPPPLRAANAPQMIWKFKTGGEIAASGVLSSDSQVFYVGSRRTPCVDAGLFAFS